MSKEEREKIIEEMCDDFCKIPIMHDIINNHPDWGISEAYRELENIDLAESSFCKGCPLTRLMKGDVE